MGHRANFVVIRGGDARAYFDSWAALGCIHSVADGPEDAAASAAEFEATDELLDWAFMEGGYLVDFDEKTLIVFGLTDEDLADEFSEFDDDEEEGGDEADESDELDDEADESGEDEDADVEEWDEEAERSSALAFLQGIAPKWKGWTLRWDQRGADAFAEHLARRGITGIKTQPATAENCLTVQVQA